MFYCLKLILKLILTVTTRVQFGIQIVAQISVMKLNLFRFGCQLDKLTLRSWEFS